MTLEKLFNKISFELQTYSTYMELKKGEVIVVNPNASPFIMLNQINWIEMIILHLQSLSRKQINVQYLSSQ